MCRIMVLNATNLMGEGEECCSSVVCLRKTWRQQPMGP